MQCATGPPDGVRAGARAAARSLLALCAAFFVPGATWLRGDPGALPLTMFVSRRAVRHHARCAERDRPPHLLQPLRLELLVCVLAFETRPFHTSAPCVTNIFCICVCSFLCALILTCVAQVCADGVVTREQLAHRWYVDPSDVVCCFLVTVSVMACIAVAVALRTVAHFD